MFGHHRQPSAIRGKAKSTRSAGRRLARDDIQKVESPRSVDFASVVGQYGQMPIVRRKHHSRHGEQTEPERSLIRSVLEGQLGLMFAGGAVPNGNGGCESFRLLVYP